MSDRKNDDIEDIKRRVFRQTFPIRFEGKTWFGCHHCHDRPKDWSDELFINARMIQGTLLRIDNYVMIAGDEVVETWYLCTKECVALYNAQLQTALLEWQCRQMLSKKDIEVTFH